MLARSIGPGCGIQALLAAKHSERVVATDVNPRALAFAAFNAALNGIDKIEFRLGDGFAPVEGESFDLIVSNPPYVISPMPRTRTATAVYPQTSSAVGSWRRRLRI